MNQSLKKEKEKKDQNQYIMITTLWPKNTTILFEFFI